MCSVGTVQQQLQAPQEPPRARPADASSTQAGLAPTNCQGGAARSPGKLLLLRGICPDVSMHLRATTADQDGRENASVQVAVAAMHVRDPCGHGRAPSTDP